MRVTEAKLTLAAVAARAGELEQAISVGIDALAAGRRSLPSLLMVAGEVDMELHRRYAGEPGLDAFREAVHSVT
jgi:hypothetical protein